LVAPIAVELALAITATVLTPHPFAVAALLLVAILVNGIAYARSRRRPLRLTLGDDGLAIDGERFTIAAAWLAPGWLVMRGRRNRRRMRLAVHRADVDDVFFTRLRRYAIAALPRVRRLRERRPA
jgi:hypothetical protein